MYVKQHIKAIHRVGGQQGRAGFLRLDMNENPGGLPAGFVESVKEELTPEYLATYPEESRMKTLLADYLGVRQDQLCLTNGSDMAIRYLFEIFAREGGTVVTVAPSFEMYRIYSLVFGLNHRPVEIGPDFEIPVESVLDAISQDTDIVVLLNPNNPVGTSYTEEEFLRIVRRAEEMDALVIVDEAYHYFYQNTFLEKALAEDHVVVLRTFSKLLSMAGCRMGYMVGDAQIIEYVNHVRPSFEVNGVALKFGERLLAEPGLIDRLLSQTLEGKRYLAENLTEHGYEPMVQDGNFIFVRPKYRTAQETANLLEAKQVLVKTYGSGLMKEYLRISTGDRPYMEQFLTVFYEVDRP